MLSKRIISVIVGSVFLISLSLSAVAVDKPESVIDENEPYGLNSEIIEFLNMHNVDLSIFDDAKTEAIVTAEELHEGANSYNESIASLINSTEAYNFTDEQVQAYVRGLVETPTTVVDRNVDSTLSTDEPPSSQNRLIDNGIGWEVKSNYGYYQSTAFAKLPSISGKVSTTASYMMYTLTGPNGSFGIDVGIGYDYGEDGGNAWRGFYKTTGMKELDYDEYNVLIKVSEVFFDATVYSTGYLRFRVLDSSDFSTVFYDISYYVGGDGIYNTNAIFNRQITLCDSAKSYNTGTSIKNAVFYDSRIYSLSGYSGQVTEENCNESYCGRFGTNSTNAEKVTVNNFDYWYYEDISISF